MALSNKLHETLKKFYKKDQKIDQNELLPALAAGIKQLTGNNFLTSTQLTEIVQNAAKKSNIAGAEELASIKSDLFQTQLKQDDMMILCSIGEPVTRYIEKLNKTKKDLISEIKNKKNQIRLIINDEYKTKFGKFRDQDGYITEPERTEIKKNLEDNPTNTSWYDSTLALTTRARDNMMLKADWVHPVVARTKSISTVFAMLQELVPDENDETDGNEISDMMNLSQSNIEDSLTFERLAPKTPCPRLFITEQRLRLHNNKTIFNFRTGAEIDVPWSRISTIPVITLQKDKKLNQNSFKFELTKSFTYMLNLR